MKQICKWFFVICMIIGALNLPVKSFAQAIDPRPLDPQPQDGGIGDPCSYDTPDNPACPIDGGVGVLLALGVGYGVKKYRSVTKNTKLNITV